MLKCNLDRKKDRIQVKGSGTAQDLMVETAVMIQILYQDINSQSPEAAKDYKNRLLGTLLDPKSPVWKEG